jgi:hypothetical protein
MSWRQLWGGQPGEEMEQESTPRFGRYWRERLKEAYTKARVRCEAILFVVFLLGGLLLLRYTSLPIDRTTWLIGFAAFVAIFLFELCFVCPYRHAKDLAAKVAAFEERMKPRIKVSGNMQTENCFTYAIGQDIEYFRAKLDSLGLEPIRNVEAHVMAIRKEGVPVPVGEYPQLMMHPGTPTLALLKNKVPGFIDVIKTNPETRQPMLALAWNYASVASWIVASEETYEIDITISSTSAPPTDFTFIFTWTGHALTSQFSVRQATPPS